jgi:hypothetical protein
MKILVSTICFIQPNKIKDGAEIYATFANRLIDSTMEKTNFDIRVATNRPELFSDALLKYGDRVSLFVDTLEDKQVWVGAFNQLLKFLALKDVPSKYDYVLYLDCDSSFFKTVDNELVTETITKLEENNQNGMVNRSGTGYFLQQLTEHCSGIANMFSAKFNFYNLNLNTVPPEWEDAPMPCEHILFLKNEDNKLQIMSDKIAEFNEKLESQIGQPYIACSPDMEAFELGIGVKVAGYKLAEIDSYIHHDVFCVKYNGSNWEKAKL